jgi:hypothetical protein
MKTSDKFDLSLGFAVGFSFHHPPLKANGMPPAAHFFEQHGSV